MFIIIFFILGAIFGSLGSVLLYRLAEDISRETIKSILIGRSYDRNTKETLKWYQLIPIVSRFLQQGKSTYTNKKLPTLYLRLEILCGLIFALTYTILHYVGHTNLLLGEGIGELIFWLGTNWFLVLLLLRDAYTMRLHLPVRAICFVRVTAWIIFGNMIPLYDAGISSVSLIIVFIVIYLGAAQYAKKRYHKDEGFGEGDVWLSAIIGLLLPFVLMYHAIPFSAYSITFVIVSFTTASSIIGIIRYLVQSAILQAKHRKISPVLAFFPAMIIGYWVILLTYGFRY